MSTGTIHLSTLEYAKQIELVYAAFIIFYLATSAIKHYYHQIMQTAQIRFHAKSFPFYDSQRFCPFLRNR